MVLSTNKTQRLCVPTTCICSNIVILNILGNSDGGRVMGQADNANASLSLARIQFSGVQIFHPASTTRRLTEFISGLFVPVIIALCSRVCRSIATKTTCDRPINGRCCGSDYLMASACIAQLWISAQLLAGIDKHLKHSESPQQCIHIYEIINCSIIVLCL